MTAHLNNDGYGEVLAHVISILEEITAEWDVGEISANTELATLNLESISFVYFIAELQQKYLLRQRLLTRIRSVHPPLADWRVADLVDLVQEIRCAHEEQREEAAS